MTEIVDDKCAVLQNPLFGEPVVCTGAPRIIVVFVISVVSVVSVHPALNSLLVAV